MRLAEDLTALSVASGTGRRASEVICVPPFGPC